MTECATELLTTQIVLSRPGEEEDSDLTIGPTCPDIEDGGIWFNDLVMPDFQLIYDTLPRSRWVTGGDLLLGATEGSSNIPVSFIAAGPDQDTLEDWKTELIEALTQHDYTVSIIVGDTTFGPWKAWPVKPSLPDKIAPRQSSLLAVRMVASITVQPPGGA